MKINKLKLQHFGKFSNREIIFSDGINIIEGSNEAGKSTVHAFIRGMLFGISKSRGKAAKGDVYSHFQPWDVPGAYQGSMDFEHEGRNYRINRVFLQGQKSVSLTEIDTGKQIETSDMGITALIPQLTPTAFDNTISAGQQRLKIGEDLGEYVRNYIANLASARDASVDVSGALSRLDARLKNIRQEQKALDTQHLAMVLDSLSEDEKDERYILEDREKVVLLKDEMSAALDSEENALIKIPVSSAEYERAAAEYENIAKFAGEFSEAAIKTDSLKARLAENEEKIRKASEEAKKAETALFEAQKRCVEASADIPGRDKKGMVKDQGVIPSDRIREDHDKAADRDRKMKIASMVLVFAGLIMALISGERLKAGIILGVIMMAAGLVLSVFSLISSAELKKLKDKLKSAEEEARDLYDETVREKQEKELAARDAAARLKELETLSASLQERVEEAEKELEKRSAEITRMEDHVKSRLGNAGIYQGNETYQAQIDRLKILAGETNKTERMHVARIEELKNGITEAEKELSRIDGNLAQYGDIGERIDEAEKDLKEALAKKDAFDTEAEALELAKAEIERISEELKSGFEKEINRSLGEECAATTSGKYTKARLDRNFGIEVMGDTDFVSSDLLSTGTKEQLFMALRMALSRLFFGDMPVPVLFDESFAYYDDERLNSALSALSNMKNRQIIIFTCNGQERQILERSGISFNLIKL